MFPLCVVINQKSAKTALYLPISLPRKTARIAGMSFQHYSKVENGDRGTHVSFMIMSRIAEALEISLDDMKEAEKEYQRLNQNDDY